MKKLRYGIIGTGGCGQGKHLSSYSLMPDQVDIIATCDIIPERADQAADRFNAEASYTDYKEMLAKENLDFVSVATPNDVHAPATIAALEAGCHVHCEKPASLTPELIQSMVDAKNKSGKKLMIGLNNRFTNWAQFIKGYVDAGKLGKIYHAKCGWKRRRGIPGKGGWFTTKDKSGGGPLIDLGVHFIDVTNYILGFPQAIAASGNTYSVFADKQAFNPNASGYTGTYDVEDLAVGMIRYQNDCSLEVEFSWASNIDKNEERYLELYGDKGGISFHDDKIKIIDTFHDSILETAPILSPEEGWGNPETRYFVQCIQNDTEVMSKPEQAIKIMQIINTLYQSAEQKKELPIL